MPGYESDDYAASEVLADVLTSQRDRLYHWLLTGRPLIDFSLSTLPEAGLAMLHLVSERDGPHTAHKRCENVIAEYVKKPPELVEAAKRGRLTRAELQKNSVPGLAMAWSQALAVEGKQSSGDTLNEIQKVTPSDVNRVAAKYLRFDQAVDALLVPEAAGKPVSAKAKRGMESFAPNKIKDVETPDWADCLLNRLTLPVSRVNPEVRVFPNGLTLIIQYAGVSDTANVYGHVKNTHTSKRQAARKEWSACSLALFLRDNITRQGRLPEGSRRYRSRFICGH